jgi:hypothetical protein
VSACRRWRTGRCQDSGPDRRVGGDEEQVQVTPPEREVDGAGQADLADQSPAGLKTWTPLKDEA